MEQTKINYEELSQGLEQQTQTFKPKKGLYDVVFLSEAQPSEFVDKDNNVVKQLKFLISVQGKEYVWYVSYARTTASLFGQIVLLAKNWGGLTGKRITLGVNEVLDKNGATRNNYMITEALTLQKGQETLV